VRTGIGMAEKQGQVHLLSREGRIQKALVGHQPERNKLSALTHHRKGTLGAGDEEKNEHSGDGKPRVL